MIYINKSVIDHFTSYSKSLMPNEACGLLVSSNDHQIIDTFVPIPNISNNPHQFYFEPKTFIRTLYEIEKDSTKWVGVIHSHPTTQAYPSMVDINNWYYSDLSYWIYSLRDGELSGYYIEGGSVRALDYEVL